MCVSLSSLSFSFSFSFHTAQELAEKSNTRSTGRRIVFFFLGHHISLLHRHQQENSHSLSRPTCFAPKKGAQVGTFGPPLVCVIVLFGSPFSPWPSIHIISCRASFCLLFLLSSSAIAIFVTFNKLFCLFCSMGLFDGEVQVGGMGWGWGCVPRMVEWQHRTEREGDGLAGLPCFTSLSIALRISHLSCEDMKTRKRSRDSRGREEERGFDKKRVPLRSAHKAGCLTYFVSPPPPTVQRPFILSAHIHTCITQPITQHIHTHTHARKTQKSKIQNTKHAKSTSVSPRNSTLPHTQPFAGERVFDRSRGGRRTE